MGAKQLKEQLHTAWPIPDSTVALAHLRKELVNDMKQSLEVVRSVCVCVCVCLGGGVRLRFISLLLRRHTFHPQFPHRHPLPSPSSPHTPSPLLSHTLTSHHPSLAPSSSILSYPLPPSLHIPSPMYSPSHHPILTPHPLPPSQVRASSELERQQVVSEVRRQAEAEKEIAIAETKKKKWVMMALMCCM